MEFLKPTRMNKVYIAFACNILDQDLLWVVYTIPTVGICRAEQRIKAAQKLGIPMPEPNGARRRRAGGLSPPAPAARPARRGAARAAAPSCGRAASGPIAERAPLPAGHLLNHHHHHPGDSGVPALLDASNSVLQQSKALQRKRNSLHDPFEELSSGARRGASLPALLPACLPARLPARPVHLPPPPPPPPRHPFVPRALQPAPARARQSLPFSPAPRRGAQGV